MRKTIENYCGGKFYGDINDNGACCNCYIIKKEGEEWLDGLLSFG